MARPMVSIAAFGLALFVLIMILFVFTGCALYLFGADLFHLQVFPTVYLLGGFCFVAGILGGVLAAQVYLEPKINRLISAVEYLYEAILRHRLTEKQRVQNAIPEGAIAILLPKPVIPEQPCYRIKVLGREEFFEYRGTQEIAFTSESHKATLLSDDEAALRIMLRCWNNQQREFRIVLEELNNQMEAIAPSSKGQ